MARVTRHLLAAHHVCRTRDPVFSVLTRIAVYIRVHFRASRKVDLTHHTLLESNAAHVNLDTTRLTNFTVDHASSLTKDFVLHWHVTGVAR